MKPSQKNLRYSPNPDLLAAQAVGLIWRNYPGYSEDNFPQSELVPSVRGNLDLAIRVLRRGTTPTLEELGERRVLGSQRAQQSVPLESVIQAYRCTERVLLLDLFSDSGNWPAEMSSHYADLIISTFDLLSQEIVDSYREAISVLETARQIVEHDLVLALASGMPPTAAEINHWALTLGLDPDTSFQAIAIAPHRTLDQLEIQRIRRGLVSTFQTIASGTILVGDTPTNVIAIFPSDAASDRVLEELRKALPGNPFSRLVSFGLGEPAESLRAAATACTQAQYAVRVALAQKREISTYSEAMLEILLILQPDLAESFATSRLGGLDKHPHLIETVESFIRNNHSQSAVARELFIHLNTVSHRLRRVAQLTGYDPLKTANLCELSLALSWRKLNDHPSEQSLT